MAKRTFYGRAIAVALASAMLALPAVSADAATTSAVLSATYFAVPLNTDADFSGGYPVVANGSSLGPNGLPVATSGVSDVTSSGEITWWSPTLNSHVTQTGTGTIALPYASNMYAPNSTGGDDSAFFETAVFKGDFVLATSGTVEFALGSDDDTFIYVDGTLFGQNPGIHATSSVNFTSPTLAAGPHSIAVFYADRARVGAYLSLNLNSQDVVITPPPSAVPEPASWAMMIAGFGMVGGTLRRRYVRRAVSVS